MRTSDRQRGDVSDHQEKHGDEKDDELRVGEADVLLRFTLRQVIAEDESAERQPDDQGERDMKKVVALVRIVPVGDRRETKKKRGPFVKHEPWLEVEAPLVLGRVPSH